MKHAQDQRRVALRRVHDDVWETTDREKADRRRRQMRLQGSNPWVFAYGRRHFVEGCVKTPRCHRVFTRNPLDDFEDVPFGSGGQDRPGHRSAASITVSARARTSSIFLVPLSTVSFRV